jgi:hypothetical protein
MNSDAKTKVVLKQNVAIKKSAVSHMRTATGMGCVSDSLNITDMQIHRKLCQQEQSFCETGITGGSLN